MEATVVGRPIKIDGMAYAPTNEQGVVLLFGRLAPRLGFHVERVQTGFPDCVARRRGRVCRIEFEYRASKYACHPARGADVVVCWDNDWEHRPRRFQHLEIIALKRYVGALPRVYAVGCDEDARGADIDRRSRLDWSVPESAQVGDLLLMYRTRPASEVRDFWRITGPFYAQKGFGRQAYVRLVGRLTRPVTYAELKADPVTRELAVVRKRFQGKSDITDDWPLLYDRIVARNPAAKRALRPWRID